MLSIGNLLAVWLIFVSPVWDWWDTRALKAAPTSKARLRYYAQTIAILALSATTACVTVGFNALFTAKGVGIHEPLLEGRSWLWWSLLILFLLFAIFQWLLPVTQVIVKYRELRYIEMAQLRPLRFVLPASAIEGRWYAALALTAAISEELLVRGFLIRYLHTFPFHVPLLPAVICSAVIFGLNHIYQGGKGAVVTGITGLIFTSIFLVTGTLAAGMLFHAVTNLSVLLYWRPKPAISWRAEQA
ncbi:MAG TPA: CPBP family intramembrane glutamic endopeptidase [Terriglobales bacterium]|nr:CPBP family intramembrane glutamic endopeptidase [Terriglobales bacterium]